MLELDFDDAVEVAHEIMGKLIPPTHLSNDAYHKMDGISASGLKQAWKDPKLYALRSELKRLPSPALETGQALHEALLEPQLYSPSKYLLNNAQIDKLIIMVHNARLMFDYITRHTINEHSLIVDDEGFRRKIRVDAYDPNQGVLYDVKTTRYNSKHKFINDAYELGYHIQQAFYIDTMRMAGYKADYFAFLVVPSESPCEPFAVQFTDRFIEDGRATYTEIIQNIMDYNNSGRVFFHQADLPAWRIKQLGEEE